MNDLITQDGVSGKIYLIRGTHVMLDSDLADLYGVQAKRLNEQVKRNVDRFPEEFRFQLTTEEAENLRSQSVTSSQVSQNAMPEGERLRSQIATLETDRRGQHRKYLPYAFTEQGVAMLSAVLRSGTAVRVSIQIMQAFVGMRRFIHNNAELFTRIGSLELRQLQTEKKVDQVLDAIGTQEPEPKQGVFFNGQIFDAYRFVNDLLRKAKKSIILIDNYVDDTVLEQLAKRRDGVSATIYTKIISKRLALDLKKHNAQYPPIDIQTLTDSHDRFLLIDNDVYHIGASLKDLGKKWFAFSKMDQAGLKVIDKIHSHRTKKGGE
jgi:hypothetical protein